MYDANETPTTQDLCGDAHVRSSALPADEIDAAFGYGSDADRLSEAEIDRLYAQHMEAINEPPVICHLPPLIPPPVRIASRCVLPDPERWPPPAA